MQGRTDEILRLCAPDGTSIAVLPLALTAIIEETLGIHHFQVILTAPAMPQVRLGELVGANPALVWASVQARVSEYLRQQGLSSCILE